MKGPIAIVAAATSAIIVAAATSNAAAATRTVQAIVPIGMYARSDNPACGMEGPLAKMADPDVVGAVGSVAGPKAAGVVLLVGRGSELAASSGGDIANFIHKASGSNDWASCADMCIAAPAGANLTKIEWSDRRGSFGEVALDKATAGITNRSNQDWSGWRNFLAFQNGDDQWLVCGTGTNWSHDQTATKRIRITYE